METKIVKIGNSQGIRIPKKLLEEKKIFSKVRIESTEEGILIFPVKSSNIRDSWISKFKKNIDNDLSFSEANLNDWDLDEWIW